MDRELSQGIVRGKAFVGEGRECSKFLRGKKKIRAFTEQREARVV